MSSIRKWFGSWRLVSWRSAVVAAVALYALIGFFVVPPIVKSQIEKRSLAILKRQATVEKVRCNPFTLSLTIEGFSLPDRPGSVVLAWDRLYANAQASSLFRWALTLKELRIENPHAALRRFEDGKVNLLELMQDVPRREGKRSLPRALLQHVAVVDGSIDLEDRHRPEPMLWELGPSQVELVDICTIPNRKGTNDVVIGLPSGATVTADGTVVVEPLGLEGRLDVAALYLPNAWRWVAHLFEFDMTSGKMDVGVDYRVSLEEDGPHLVVDNADVRITDFGFRWEGHDIDLLRVDGITVAGGHLEWPEQKLAAESVLIDRATAFAWIEADGTPSWDVLVPKESQQQVEAAYQTLEERIHASAQVGRFEVRDAGAEFEDRSVSPPIRFKAHDVDLVVTGITTGHGTTWPFEGSGTFAEAARGSARGRVGASPLALETEVTLDNLDLAKYQPYLAALAPIELEAGVLRAAGTVHASQPEGGDGLLASYQGGFEVTGLDLDETLTGDKLLGWGDLKVDGIDARLQPMSADVREVFIDNAGLEITVAENGTINLLEFMKALGEGDEGGPLPPVRIARTRLKNCYGIYTDKTVSGPFRMALTPIDGTITAITTDSSAPAVLDIDAAIESGGLVRVEGELDPFDYQRFSDFGIDVRDMLLPAVTPMSVKFIGHPIDDGDVTLDLDYDIADRYLKATNHIEADDLDLGPKVEGGGLVKLPWKLGVALLKDKEGRITLDIPFEGSFDTPGFGMATAAGAATKEVFTELLKSPFRLLSRIGGGDQDLEFVEFAAGSALLEERAVQNLTTLSAGLVERPALALAINGSYDAEADGLALREAALRQEFLARGVSAEDVNVIIPLEALESLHAERLLAPSLDVVRAEHSSAPAEEGAAPVLDEVAYRLAVREALVASQPVADGAVAALAAARAEAIRAFLVDQAMLDPARVSIAAEPQVQTDSGSWVRCQLELTAE